MIAWRELDPAEEVLTFLAGIVLFKTLEREGSIVITTKDLDAFFKALGSVWVEPHFNESTGDIRLTHRKTKDDA